MKNKIIEKHDPEKDIKYAFHKVMDLYHFHSYGLAYNYFKKNFKKHDNKVIVGFNDFEYLHPYGKFFSYTLNNPKCVKDITDFSKEILKQRINYKKNFGERQMKLQEAIEYMKKQKRCYRLINNRKVVYKMDYFISKDGKHESYLLFVKHIRENKWIQVKFSTSLFDNDWYIL